MPFSEPPSWTRDRDDRLKKQYPQLQSTTIDTLLAVDNYGSRRGQPPSGFSQTAMGLAAARPEQTGTTWRSVAAEQDAMERFREIDRASVRQRPESVTGLETINQAKARMGAMQGDPYAPESAGSFPRVPGVYPRQRPEQERGILGEGYSRARQGSLGFFTGSNPLESVRQAAGGAFGNQTFDPADLGFVRNMKPGDTGYDSVLQAMDSLTRPETFVLGAGGRAVAGAARGIPAIGRAAGALLDPVLGSSNAGVRYLGEAGLDFGAGTAVREAAERTDNPYLIAGAGLAGGVGAAGVMGAARRAPQAFRAADDAIVDSAMRAAAGPAEAGVGPMRLPSGNEVPYFRPARVAESPTPGDFTRLPPAPEAGYVYHGTSVDNLQDIASEGFLRRFRPDYGTDQSMWPDGSTARRSYWTDNPSTAASFVPEGNPALVRVREGGRFAVERGTGDRYIERSVPARAIEYLADDGSWQPVKNLSGPPPRVTPGAVDPVIPGVTPRGRASVQGSTFTPDEEAALIASIEDVPDDVIAEAAERLRRTNKIRASQGKPPMTEVPEAWLRPTRKRPATPTPDAPAQIVEPLTPAVVDDLQKKIAREGMTPENREAVQSALGQLFTPEQMPPPSQVTGGRIGEAIIGRFDEAQRAALDDLGAPSLADAPPPRAGGTRPPIPPDDAGAQGMFGGFEPPKTPAPSFGERLRDLASLPITAKSTYDLSAPGRQLAPMLYAHPTAIDDVLKAQTAALRSQAAFDASQEALRKRPWAAYRDLAGVELGGITDGLVREEQIGSRLAERLLPGSTRFNDAYVAAVNEGRDWLFKLMLDQMEPSMLTEAGLRAGGIEELQRIGRLVNASTGRGTIAKTLTENQVLGQPLFWAPKLLAGRVQLPFGVFSSSSIVRKEAARQVAAFVGINMAILGMIKATGAADVEIDPRSSDFGQARVGNRRFDVWAGYRPIVNVVARLGISATNRAGLTDMDNIKRINTPEQAGSTYSRDSLDIVSRFLRTKLAPLSGAAITQATGENVIGEPVGEGWTRAGRLGVDLLAPIFLANLAEEVILGAQAGDMGRVAEALAAAPFEFAGGGGGYYKPSPGQIAQGGGYSTLKPADQFEAIPDETWRRLKEQPALSEQLAPYGSYLDWSDAVEDRVTEDPRVANLSAGARDQVVKKVLDAMPVKDVWQRVNGIIETAWVTQHPKEAKRLWDKTVESGLKWGEDGYWKPTIEQQRIIMEATR
jgi:hypothetical protein